MNIKTKKILSVMIISLTLLFCITITYAFFAAEVTGTDASTSVYFATGGQGITITFEGGDQVNLSNIYPRAEAWLEKDITIRSTAISSDVTSIYTFNMVVEENGYHPEDIKYTFTPKTLTGVEEGTSTGTNDLTNLDNRIDIGHGLVKGTSAAEITYTLKVYFVNDPTRNQNTGSAMTAKFYVTYNWGNPVNLIVNLEGGTGLTSTQVAANSSITLQEPTKPGYIFTGWEVTGATIEGNLLTMGTTNATITATYREPTNFELDSWATIAANVKTEDGRNRYAVGHTRDITLVSPDEKINGKTVKLRVANNSNYDCTLESKTACGFVVEFQDIIKNHRMNATETNVGGWPATEMRDYLNGTFEGDAASQNPSAIINALPADLRAVIADTTVVSGHGNTSGETNFTSTDKLYLLSTREVWGDCIGGKNDDAGCRDYGSSNTITRQLDYYANLGVLSTDSTKYAGAKKPLNGRNSFWWLRSASSNSNNLFRGVNYNGSNYYINASYGFMYGVSPAFRIG